METYRVTYGRDLVGKYGSLKDAKQAVKDHPEFVKSKYTRKGRPRSGNEDLKSFYIIDNSGDMYYIY